MRNEEYKIKGFTLIEITIVVIIITIFASISLPNYFMMRERAYVADAIHLLKVLYAAEQRYYVYNKTFTANLNQLDVTITMPSTFNTLVLQSADPIVHMTRVKASPDNYRIGINANGSILCVEGGAGSNFCQILGY